MSRYIATRAIRGANALVTEADLMLKRALVEKGPDTPVAFPNTAYYLPVINGMTRRPGRDTRPIGTGHAACLVVVASGSLRQQMDALSGGDSR